MAASLLCFVQVLVGVVGVIAANKHATNVSCVMIAYLFLAPAGALTLAWAGTWLLAFQDSFPVFARRHWDVVSQLVPETVGKATNQTLRAVQASHIMEDTAPWAATVLFG